MMELVEAGLTFDEATAYFKDKVPLKSTEFRKLENEYKTRAFSVAGYTSLKMLETFKETLERALEEGATKEEFRQEMNRFLGKKGYAGLTPFQADNIFRTNMQTAYQVGHYRRMTDPEVVSRRPYWQYDAVEDSRTRLAHRGMHGKVFAADDPFWDTWYPPNGYRCRCGVRTLSSRQVAALGLEVETGVPAFVETGSRLVPAVPDPGFDANPAKRAWDPSADLPEPLRTIYLERENRPNGAERG